MKELLSVILMGVAFSAWVLVQQATIHEAFRVDAVWKRGLEAQLSSQASDIDELRRTICRYAASAGALDCPP